ncbi:hypothetical protein TSEDIMI_20190 [Tenacibaculum sediminilitoris]|uniref:hypothetical protein n=1 Tax=Tenacibaculum sediminilitoris TaxID=1820334 RepID=UPI0038950C77
MPCVADALGMATDSNGVLWELNSNGEFHTNAYDDNNVNVYSVNQIIEGVRSFPARRQAGIDAMNAHMMKTGGIHEDNTIAEFFMGSSLARNMFKRTTRSKVFHYGSDKATLNNLKLMKAEEGVSQVLLHGHYDFFIIDGVKTSPKDLARMLLSDKIKRKSTIRLVSCHTGKFSDGAAYQLSRYLKSTVKAPTNAVRTLNNGSYEIMDEGIWKVFNK